MGENGEFWRLAQDFMDSETTDGLPVSEPPVTEAAEGSTNVVAVTQRLMPGSPGVLVALALVGVLVVASVISVVLWSLSDYDPNDVDEDGIANGVDDYYDGFTEWTSRIAVDHDGDMT